MPDITACAAKCTACWEEPHCRSIVGGGDALGQARREPRRTPDVERLRADLVDASPVHQYRHHEVSGRRALFNWGWTRSPIASRQCAATLGSIAEPRDTWGEDGTVRAAPPAGGEAGTVRGAPPRAGIPTAPGSASRRRDTTATAATGRRALNDGRVGRRDGGQRWATGRRMAMRAPVRVWRVSVAGRAVAVLGAAVALTVAVVLPVSLRTRVSSSASWTSSSRQPSRSQRC